MANLKTFEIEDGFYQTIDIDLIRSSFSPARLMGTTSIQKAYEFLFSDYPEGLPTFEGVDMPKQFKGMMAGLTFMVDNLDNEAALRRYLFAMGQRHVDYGAHEQKYEWVTNSIVKSLAYYYREHWTMELNEEWRKFLNVVKALTMHGHRAAVNGEAPSAPTP